jgi:hypothetical protein
MNNEKLCEINSDSFTNLLNIIVRIHCLNEYETLAYVNIVTCISEQDEVRTGNWIY